MESGINKVVVPSQLSAVDDDSVEGLRLKLELAKIELEREKLQCKSHEEAIEPRYASGHVSSAVRSALPRTEDNDALSFLHTWKTTMELNNVDKTLWYHKCRLH